VPICDAGIGNKLREKVDEAIHLSSACYCTAKTLVSFPRLFLFVSLPLPRLPVMGHSQSRSLSQTSNDIVSVHTHYLSDSPSIVIQPASDYAFTAIIHILNAMHPEMRCGLSGSRNWKKTKPHPSIREMGSSIRLSLVQPFFHSNRPFPPVSSDCEW
jgi:hypothetical protein